MILNNKVYDILKWVALVVLPAIAALILTVFGIWGINYGEQIAATITAVDTFLGALLGISSIKYAKEQKEANNAEGLQ